jgi:hypothetical protein
MDDLLSAIGAAPPCPERSRAVVALASLRRSLFPDAALETLHPIHDTVHQERARA